MNAIIREVQNGCLKDICKIKSVFSNRRDAPGLNIARKQGIKIKVIDSSETKKKEYNRSLLDYLEKQNPDYIVLAGYMKILPPSIVAAFPRRIINIHPADTAKHQGLHGYEWAYEKGLMETKITVHFVDDGLDTGDVIAKRKVDLRNAKSVEDVEESGLQVEHHFYSECLEKLFRGKLE